MPNRKKNEWLVVVGVLLVFWLGYALDWVLPAIDLTEWGVVPRTLRGVPGIAAMHFIHGSWGHLFGNSIPFFILASLLIGSRHRALMTIVEIAVAGGVLLWCFGSFATHVGASLLIYGMSSYLVLTGILEKRLLAIGVAMLVVFLYGGTLLWGILPTQVGVSWDGHLLGAVGGAVVAFVHWKIGLTRSRESSPRIADRLDA